MAEYKLKGVVELVVPANAGMLLVIRLTSAGVIARAGLTIDEMDNLKIAVEEACNCLIGQANPPERLKLAFERVADALEIHVRAEGVCAQREAAEPAPEGEVTAEAELEIVRMILSALADEVAFEVNGGWISSIRIRTALKR